MNYLRTRYAGVVAFHLLLFLVQGCAGQSYTTSSTLFRLDRPFWTRAGEPISIHFSPPGEVVSWRTKLSGNDDRDAGLSEVFEPFRPDATPLHERVNAKFRERGFRVTPPESAEAGDLQLSINVAWGASREYLGFVHLLEDDYLATVPIGAYHACFVIEGTLEQQMEAKQEHQVLWTARARACERIGRRWRDADQRAVVESAIEKAWAEATEKFERQLFSWSGRWGAQRTRHGTFQ